jgi:hypothetical protein
MRVVRGCLYGMMFAAILWTVLALTAVAAAALIL